MDTIQVKPDINQLMNQLAANMEARIRILEQIQDTSSDIIRAEELINMEKENLNTTRLGIRLMEITDLITSGIDDIIQKKKNTPNTIDIDKEITTKEGIACTDCPIKENCKYPTLRDSIKQI